LIINSAAYFEDWSQIQQLLTEKCGDTYTANAGTAHVYGGELEATLKVTSELAVSTGLAYTHAKLVEAPAGSAFQAGDRVQNVPDWTDTTAITYTRPAMTNYDLVLRAANVYTGTATDASFSPITQLPSRNIANLRAGMTSRDHVSVFLFVDNVTNKHAYIGDPEEIFTFVPSLDRVTTNQPRTIGVQISYGVGAK
jgi:outer membrane receptor protein involved in Fe transport